MYILYIYYFLQFIVLFLHLPMFSNKSHIEGYPFGVWSKMGCSLLSYISYDFTNI